MGICLIVGIYTTLGGFRAVVATDKLQYVIVALYILAMAWFALQGMWQQHSRVLPATEFITLKTGRSWADMAGPGILTIIVGLVAYLPGWLFETDVWVRVQAAKNATAARKGMLIAAVNAFFFVGVLPLFIGVAALALFPVANGAAPAIVGNEGDAIFVALVQNFAPVWLALLVAVGLVAAAMSTIDTCVNVMALSIAYDMFTLHQRAQGKKLSQLITIFAVIAAGIFALNTESLWDIFYLSGGILTTAVAFPVAAVFIPMANPKGVIYSAICGFSGTIAFYFMQTYGFLVNIQPDWLNSTELAYILWGMGFAVAGYVVGLAMDLREKS
jgi:SSS family solute:Na+ symporter